MTQTKTTEGKKTPVWMVDPEEKPREVILQRSGCKVLIHPSTFETMQKAQRIAGSDESAYGAVLVSLICEIEGRFYTPEEIKLMNMQDGLQLMGEVSGENFTLALKTS